MGEATKAALGQETQLVTEALNQGGDDCAKRKIPHHRLLKLRAVATRFHGDTGMPHHT